MFINLAFPPFGGAASRRVTKMVKHLAPLGYRSAVVTAPRVVGPLIDLESLKDVPEGTEVIRTLSLEPVPPPGREWPLMMEFRRILNVPMVPNVSVLWAVCAAVPAIRAARRHKPAAIVCSAPEFASFLVGAAVKGALGTPLVLDYRDEWSWHPVKMESVRGSALRGAKRGLEERLEGALCRYADMVIANTDGFKEMFISRLGLPGDKAAVIPNGYDPDDFPEVPGGRPRNEFVITYLGSVDHASLLPPELFEALARAADGAGADIVLRVVGNVYPELRGKVEAMAGDGVRVDFRGFLPAREALGFVLEGDANLLVLDDIEGKERYHNLKLFDYMFARKPILLYGQDPSEMARAVRGSGLGVVVRRGDAEALAAALSDLVSGRAGADPNEEYIALYDYGRLAAELASLIEGLWTSR